MPFVMRAKRLRCSMSRGVTAAATSFNPTPARSLSPSMSLSLRGGDGPLMYNEEYIETPVVPTPMGMDRVDTLIGERKDAALSPPLWGWTAARRL